MKSVMKKNCKFEGLNDWNIWISFYRKQLEQLKKGADIDVYLKDTAQDLVDAGNEELAKFKSASRVTGLAKLRFVWLFWSVL